MLDMRLARFALIVLLLAGCTGDDDGGGGGTPDAAGVCELPATAITCTTGDDTPCTAVCDVAYCYTFGTGGGGGTGSTICTRNCTTADDCPEGWSCNGMGRCKNP